ncbi:translation initiation factor [Neochlamydia sp. AcF65]|uniref:translation initiation factor n=1 Tax=Neochlamydia sp. AcF65 TaxID=2795735 RepID=UPI001BC9D80F|nr:translation initiation factor [Neochlamydia sp. AcF65]
MPFTIEGQWIPSKPASSKPLKGVKIRLVKRGKNILTVILNLNIPSNELVHLASLLKKKLGCGGAAKDADIEIQGDNVSKVKKILEEYGIKSS